MILPEGEKSPYFPAYRNFREQGGAATIMLLDEIGKGVEVHDMGSGIEKEAADKSNLSDKMQTEKGHLTYCTNNSIRRKLAGHFSSLQQFSIY